ncbi:MAG: prepilin-type N-terminal cleavage/methylation domain-containing protein [Phycisphaerae bacterium]|nr:prepilin-type N-terminal cleavage/methylation domain-containing protein [Phycisphaerae bacterium]
MMRRIHPTQQKAFTLIELLVVIAIISLLVSILVPSLRQAKELAREVTCLSNARNIGVVLQFYAQDYDNTFPIPYNPSHSRNAYHSWPVALGVYIADESSIDPDVSMTVKNQPEMVAESFQCPTLLQIHPTSGNTYVMNDRDDAENSFHDGLDVEMVKDPYCRIVVGEGACTTGGWFSDQFWSISTLGFYHHEGQVVGTIDVGGNSHEQTDGRGTLLMVDGSVFTAIPDDINTAYFVKPYSK